MTLIACLAGKDQAEILTDTLAYTALGEELAYTSKTVLVPHLDAALAVAGGEDMKGWVHMMLSMMNRVGGNFDGLITVLPKHLRDLWATTLDGRRKLVASQGTETEVSSSVIVVVGRSTAQDRFQAWTFCSDFDFAPDEQIGLFVTPAPWSCPPAAHEVAELRQVLVEHPDANAEARFASWLAQPTPKPPGGMKGWVELGKQVRADRALLDIRTGFKRMIGGELHYTRLEPGRASIRRPYRFNDEGEELVRLVAGTYHPESLLSACLCGSGNRYMDCCFEESELRHRTDLIFDAADTLPIPGDPQ
jgi:hypothetical protein